jgi:MYXO-CTERM domain-containing protein
VLRLQELAGARSCVQAQCAATEAWLCDRYGRCPAAGTPPESPDHDAGIDAAAPDAGEGVCVGSACGENGGCGCVLGDRTRASGAWFVLALAIAAVRGRRRRG